MDSSAVPEVGDDSDENHVLRPAAASTTAAVEQNCHDENLNRNLEVDNTIRRKRGRPFKNTPKKDQENKSKSKVKVIAPVSFIRNVIDRHAVFAFYY